LSPEVGKTCIKEKFDFSCFIKFLIKIGLKCFPECESNSQSVLYTVEQYILPLLGKVNVERSVQNTRLTKLIALANTKVMVEFMTDLFTVVTQDIYHRYTLVKGQMTFDLFLNFARDHDIFPFECSKAALYRIFHSLSHFSETMNPATSSRELRKQMSNLDISSMSPRALDQLT